MVLEPCVAKGLQGAIGIRPQTPAAAPPPSLTTPCTSDVFSLKKSYYVVSHCACIADRPGALNL